MLCGIFLLIRKVAQIIMKLFALLTSQTCNREDMPYIKIVSFSWKLLRCSSGF